MSDSKTYDGELTCNFTFLDDNMNVELKTVKIPFEYSFNDIVKIVILILTYK